MAYPKRLLRDGEDIVLDLQPHWWFFAKHIAATVALLVALIAIVGFSSGDVEHVTLLVWAVFLVVWAGWVALKYFDWRFTHFVLTTERVIFRTGVLAKRGVEIPLGRINNINFNQGVWERMIGAGDLEIESAGRDGQTHFENVQHPDGVQQEIYRMMEAAERRRATWSQAPAPAPAAPTAPTASVPDQIAQLAALRDSGAITPQEYEAKKAELLGRM